MTGGFQANMHNPCENAVPTFLLKLKASHWVWAKWFPISTVDLHDLLMEAENETSPKASENPTKPKKDNQTNSIYYLQICENIILYGFLVEKISIDYEQKSMQTWRTLPMQEALRMLSASLHDGFTSAATRYPAVASVAEVTMPFLMACARPWKLLNWKNMP